MDKPYDEMTPEERQKANDDDIRRRREQRKKLQAAASKPEEEKKTEVDEEDSELPLVDESIANSVTEQVAPDQVVGEEERPASKSEPPPREEPSRPPPLPKDAQQAHQNGIRTWMYRHAAWLCILSASAFILVLCAVIADMAKHEKAKNGESKKGLIMGFFFPDEPKPVVLHPKPFEVLHAEKPVCTPLLTPKCGKGPLCQIAFGKKQKLSEETLLLQGRFTHLCENGLPDSAKEEFAVALTSSEIKAATNLSVKEYEYALLHGKPAESWKWDVRRYKRIRLKK